MFNGCFLLLASPAIPVSGGESAAAAAEPPSRRVLNAEVALFGGSLGKHHVASVELDSDQVHMFWVNYIPGIVLVSIVDPE